MYSENKSNTIFIFHFILNKNGNEKMNTRECLFNILEPPAFLKKHVANSLHMLGLSTLYLCVCQCVYVSVDSG